MKRIIAVAALMFLGLPTISAQEQIDQDSDLLTKDDQSPLIELEQPEKGRLDGQLMQQFRYVAKDLRCPTCQGMSVLESDASFSRQIKDMVEKKVREGWQKQRILDFFTERYGPWILREPPKEGFSMLAWAVPVALLMLGPFFMWAGTWRRRVDVETGGIRARSEIIEEMINRLEVMRQSSDGESDS